jgi:cardiolipin synthase
MSAGKPGKRNTYTLHNKVELIRGGRNYFDLLEQIIHRAKHIIHLQVYIFNEDETGMRITEALIKAAQRGVEIYIVVDGYASRNISSGFIQNLKKHGIHFRWFNPFFKNRYFYFGRRLHHKVVVADASESLVGGINITNKYNDFDQPAWLDWALHVQGEVSLTLYEICRDIWNRSRWWKKARSATKLAITPTFLENECFVRARTNDWVRNKNQISKSYTEMLKKAQHSIIIMSSYFLPGLNMKKNIIAAAKRGVNVKLIVAGISDVQLAKQAERYMYRWILKNNIELYEYTKNVLHGKLSVSDSKWATIGSYNINNISAYASIELNLDVLDESFAKETEVILQKIIHDDCTQIKAGEYGVKETFFMRIWQRICYDIYRAILYLFTFYFKRRHG